MQSASDKLISWLFETKAVRVCPQDKPFWYTSGTIGPYYINTHFLYGSEDKANELLKTIDIEKNSIYTCPSKLLAITLDNYRTDAIYRGLIDAMSDYIRDNINLSQIDYLSGGERRDWFFSLILADILDKPHITIYKDLKAVVTVNGKTEDLMDITGKKVLHIADLITEASSYERAWLPALRSHGAEMKWSVVVVDRKQGGGELLEREGVKSYAMVSIDKKLFEGAKNMGLIQPEQQKMLNDYIDYPKEAMKGFLKSHPEFMENALNGDPKTRERALLCIDKKFYE
ncbi:MAG: hypothetical protein K0R31_2515 [Clostridiales bacterium]|nr:hypothetical protein [Clostridiales bacterium]